MLTINMLLPFAILLLLTGSIFCQAPQQLFKKLPLDSIGVRCYEMLCAKDGSVIFTSNAGMWKLKGHQLEGPPVAYNGQLRDAKTGAKNGYIKNWRNFLAEDSIRAMAAGADSIFFYATHDNKLFYSNDGIPGVGWPPFIFPPKGKPVGKVSSLYIDKDGDLFAGTAADNFYIIKGAANKKSYQNTEMNIVDSSVVVVRGEKPVQQIMLAAGTGVFSFAQDSTNKNIVWIGTNHGLYSYNKATGQSKSVARADNTSATMLTITHIETDKQSNLWFSTLEEGMGFYDQQRDAVHFYRYLKKISSSETMYPVNTFCYKSDHEFFVAVADSLPAIFNKNSGAWVFIDDSSLHGSVNTTTDIKVDKAGNLLLIKDGVLYICSGNKNNEIAAAVKPDTALLAPFIRAVSLQNGEELATISYRAEWLKELTLEYNQNSFVIHYDLNEFGDERPAQFAWKIAGVTDGWVIMPMLQTDSARFAFIQHLDPGNYLFELKVKVGNEDWRKQQAQMIIHVSTPFWQTWWFWILLPAVFCTAVYAIIQLRVKAVRKAEQVKAKHEKQLLELEARALRSQMNPHFIFNCLNSIKSLIQQHEEEKSVAYLTTFSKLIRTLFNNADKKEISLYDEIETCRLYLQLEAMRFDAKFTWSVDTDPNIDLKSIAVPALVVQPFIENAIWHGIIPAGPGGNVSLQILRIHNAIEIIIEDNGIGREASRQNKSGSSATHHSKGVNLTQSRLELNNLLQHRHARLDIIDKKDAAGKAAGTRVVITIKEEI